MDDISDVLRDGAELVKQALAGTVEPRERAIAGFRIAKRMIRHGLQFKRTQRNLYRQWVNLAHTRLILALNWRAHSKA